MSGEFRFKVNLGGIIDILSNHIYSNEGVFLRELLQNSVDAIRAREIYDEDFNSGEILVNLINRDTIVFEDNGIGLTEEEVHKFLAIIGESSKRGDKNALLANDYIGHFGIGLLSCFMVSDEINVITTSAKDKTTTRWSGRPDGTYSISKLDSKVECGTKVYLKCKKGSEEFFDYDYIMDKLKYYGDFLPVPIYLEMDDLDNRINSKMPLWKDKSLSKRQLLEIGEEYFGERFIDVINIESKSGDIEGYAYILARKTLNNISTNHRIYLKNMLLTEEGKNILPSWAVFVRCILNTNNLTPTASREAFYENRVLDKTRDELGECIIEYLSLLAKLDEELLASIINVHSLSIKGLAVEDEEIYKKFIDYLSFPTTEGVKTGYELRTKYKKLVYTKSLDKFRQMSSIFIAQNELLINGGYIYDAEILEKFQSVFNDVEIEEVSSINVIEIMEDLTFEEQEDSYELLRNARISLSQYQCDVLVKKFKPIDLPVLYVLNEEAALFRNIIHDKENIKNSFIDMLDVFEKELESEASSTLYFNINNPLVKKLLKVDNRKLLSNGIKLLYVQAILIGHFPIKNNEMKVLNDGIISLIELGIKE